ncbi:MAG: hydroxymethylglutaryl-CoA lyase [Terracidiphilus sp.]
MSNSVKIIECPRDAWQGLPSQIPLELKTSYLRKLITAGFTHIDAVSFVSPAAVPQMADAEQVLQSLDAPDGVEIIGVVVNAKGAERAISTGAVQTLGFPYSISPEFLRRNQHQTPEESLDALETVGELAYKARVNVTAYISMAFGNPYGDAWSVDEVADACELLIDTGVRQITLADTVGLAAPERIGETVARAFADGNAVEIGVHLHARPAEAAAKIRAAYEAGCRRFDSAIGGLGGCPFAQDALVGNIPTEILIDELKSLGAALPALEPLEPLIESSADLASRFGPRTQ